MNVWYEDVIVVMTSAQKKSIELPMRKAKEYIHKMYPLLFSEEFSQTRLGGTGSSRGN